MSLKPGMYVRCNIDEDQQEGRVYLLGQIKSINQDTEQVDVEFHDLLRLADFFENVPQQRTYFLKQVKRCKILGESNVILSSFDQGVIINDAGQDHDGYLQYYVETYGTNKSIKQVSERDLMVQFTRGDYSPVNQMLNYEFHNPMWYKNRTVVSDAMNVLKNSSFGFEVLVGSRVYLMHHQIDTIVRGLSEEKCRLMLADEVGLGKTIEAGVIMKGIKNRVKPCRTLVLVPRALIKQWQNELSYKFWTDLPIWTGGDVYKGKFDVLMAIEDLEAASAKEIISTKWDLCIVDETHRLVGNEKLYSKVFSISRNSDNLLLLSATPIQQRKTEYLDLLRLLDPSKYDKMSSAEFESLLEKSKYIKEKIHELMKDLKYYIEDELCEDYIEQFERMNEKLNDEVIAKLISLMDVDSSDQGLNIAKVILAYISRNYEIEKNIIRHRRMEIADQVPGRTFELIGYEMAGASQGYYEYETYNALVEYLSYLNKIETSALGAFKRILLSAMFSSPWALQGLLEQRMNVTTGRGKAAEQIIAKVPTINDTEETELLNTVLYNCKEWARANNEEIEKISYLQNHPEEIKGRIVQLADYLGENTDNAKTLVFTQWTQTAEKLDELFCKKFGTKKVARFYSGKSIDEMESEVKRFQSDRGCQFMICDKLGGEGRNFQIADYVVHVDLPWSPVELEQRIGRLDRIGRDPKKSVVSLISLAEHTIEEDLFSLWNQGLGIFQESLSGLEIALNDVERNIEESLYFDLKYGLRHALDQIQQSSNDMRKEVDKERYFDLAKQLDVENSQKLSVLIDKFDANGGELLFNSMDSWATMAGLSSDRYQGESKEEQSDVIISYAPHGFKMGATKNTFFCPPNTKEALVRAKTKNEIRGTFSRDFAVKREDLVFFAPGEPIYNSIVLNAMETCRGRSCAFEIPAEFDWEGIVFTWNVGFDSRSLIENGHGLSSVNLIQGELPVDQFHTAHPYYSKHSDVNQAVVIRRLREWTEENRFSIIKKFTVHLGKRSNTEKGLLYFKSKHKKEDWSKFIKKYYSESQAMVRDEARKRIDLEKVRDRFDRLLIANKAANLYFEHQEIKLYEDNQLRSKLDALIKGLDNPIIKLDSVAYVRMVNKSCCAQSI